MGISTHSKLATWRSRLTAYADSGASATFRVYGEATKDPAAYSTYADFMGRALTTGYVTWQTGNWNEGQEYSVDVTSVVQEVMNLPTKGNAMALQVRPGGIVGTKQAWSVDGEKLPPARLRLTYTRTVTTTTTTYTYDAANRLVSVNGQAYTWDNNGNLTNDGNKMYAYNQANRLIAVKDQQSIFSFVYNGDGSRVKQTVDGEAITYTLDLAAPLVTVLAQQDAVSSTHYVYALGTRPLAQHDDDGWAYLLPDALGSVRQLVDSDGNVTLAQAYQPYGSLLESQGSARSTFDYAGEQTDTTGLTYLRARYYDSVTGRFFQQDPSGLESNLYAYATANPVNKTDPSGLFSGEFGQVCCRRGPYVSHATSAFDRLREIRENEVWGNGAEALFKSFEDCELLKR